MEKKHYSLAEMEPVIRKVLAEGGTFRFYPKGTSMEPMIHQGQDQVFLAPIPKKLKKYQIVLYKRDNDAFVLHRIVKVCKDSYTMRGDNQFVLEPGIRRDQMIGIVCGLKTSKGEIDTECFAFRMKSAIWVKTAGIRRVFLAVKRRISKIININNERKDML